MGKPFFQFKRFTIHQDRCAMKVGTDGVLLGAWANIRNADRILDIGTGTGLIALMCAQRNPSAEIWAIEIDKDSSIQAGENFENSEFNEALHVQHCSLQEFRTDMLFDSIVCNPPFFRAGTPSPSYGRYLARQAESLPLKILIESATKLLSEDGILHLVLPIDREEELGLLCDNHGLHAQRKCVVYPAYGKSPKRLLVEFSKNSELPTVNEELTIEKEERFDYTDDFIKLTREFYPKMK